MDIKAGMIGVSNYKNFTGIDAHFPCDLCKGEITTKFDFSRVSHFRFISCNRCHKEYDLHSHIIYSNQHGNSNILYSNNSNIDILIGSGLLRQCEESNIVYYNGVTSKELWELIEPILNEKTKGSGAIKRSGSRQRFRKDFE